MRHNISQQKATSQLLTAIDNLHQLEELQYLIELAERSDEIHIPNAEKRIGLLLRLYLEQGQPLLNEAIKALNTYHDATYLKCRGFHHD